MALKALREFNGFDIDSFLQGKRLTATGCTPWKDYASGQPLGTKVEVAITEDKTPYKPGKDGTPVSNLYEKLVFKVNKNINVPIGAAVVPVGAVATIYGDYQNQLSIRVTDIKVIQPTAPVNGGQPSAPANPGKRIG